MFIKKFKFRSGLVNVNSSFLNTIMEEESRIFISRLFWARYIKIVTAGKKESFKELLFSCY